MLHVELGSAQSVEETRCGLAATGSITGVFAKRARKCGQRAMPVFARFGDERRGHRFLREAAFSV